MNLTVNRFNNQIGFYGQNDDEKNKRNVTPSDVATATGATGAAATGTKMAKGSGFDMFKSNSQIGQISRETTNAIRGIKKPVKSARGLYPRFMQAFRNTKADILKWADGIKNSSLLKPILKSKAFNAVAGALGVGMGLFVTITGLGDIANMVSEYTSK